MNRLPLTGGGCGSGASATAAAKPGTRTGRRKRTPSARIEQKRCKLVARKHAGCNLMQRKIGHTAIVRIEPWLSAPAERPGARGGGKRQCKPDRKSTRLNSSHVKISYAV